MIDVPRCPYCESGRTGYVIGTRDQAFCTDCEREFNATVARVYRFMDAVRASVKHDVTTIAESFRENG